MIAPKSIKTVLYCPKQFFTVHNIYLSFSDMNKIYEVSEILARRGDDIITGHIPLFVNSMIARDYVMPYLKYGVKLLLKLVI